MITRLGLDFSINGPMDVMSVTLKFVADWHMKLKTVNEDLNISDWVRLTGGLRS